MEAFVIVILFLAALVVPILWLILSGRVRENPFTRLPITIGLRLGGTRPLWKAKPREFHTARYRRRHRPKSHTPPSRWTR